MVALADCNNFFVSCERVFRPDLQGKPVVVMSGNDGCVVSRSNEAKALGIPMGEPLFKMRDLIEKHHVHCFSSNFSLYGDLSSRVMSLLSKHTACLEQYSIDESFFFLSHLRPEEMKPECEGIVREVLRGVGIPISIGIAPTKTLAKVASKYAKKYPAYHGACMIDSDEKRRKALLDFPVGDVWGIGRKARQYLAQAGVTTALQLADMPEYLVRKLLHKPGWQTWKELNGDSCVTLSDLPEKQSITCSRTYAEGVTERAPLEKYLADFTANCARKLRMQHSVCRQVFFFVETSRFRTDEWQKQIYRSLAFPVATANTQELQNAVLQAFRQEWLPGYKFKRAGVILTNISSDHEVQQDLFDTRDRLREGRLQEAIDKVNARYGKQALVSATQIATKQTDSMLRLEHLSPCYSTNIHDVIVLKC